MKTAVSYMLIAYLWTVVVILPGIHTADPAHHHHPFDHSAKAEEDPCHRKMYHRDFDKGCKHDSHYANPVEVCSLCDLFLNADVFSFFHHADEAGFQFTSQNLICLKPIYPFLFFFANSVRGPPAI